MDGLSLSIGSLSDDGLGYSDRLSNSRASPNGASLSMKMRSEGTKLFSRTSALPPVTKRKTPKNIHAPKVVPKSDISRMYERLSGQFESEGFESYPDRGTIHHPSTYCVRCSSHASLCVPCADDMSNKAVNFFRKSQALGAYHLLSGAIKQAGCQTVIRSVIFYLWKNYLKENLQARNKRKNQSRKKYEISLMTPTFNAWVSLTKWTVKDKHIRKVIDLEDRIKLLESQVQKLNTEKNVAEFQAKKASKSYDECVAVKNEQTTTIKQLTKTLYSEQYRVLKLATFVHSVTPQLFSILNKNAKGVTQATTKQVQFCQSIASSAMSYSKVLKPNNKGKKAPAFSPVKATGSFSSWSTKSPELVAWVNHQSRNANMMTLGTGDSAIELDKYLPPFRDIRKLTELRNGQQLCRIAVKLVLSLQNQRAVIPKAPPPRGKNGPGPPLPSAPPPPQSAVSGGGVAGPVFTFTNEHAQDIKENVAEPLGLIYLTQNLLVTALKCPEITIEQIETGDPLALEALIGSLMLISTDMDGEVSAEEKADLIKFSGTVDNVKHEIDKTIAQSVAARMLTFPEEYFRDEEKERRLEEERQYALENKDKLRKEKREAEKAARMEQKRRASRPDNGDVVQDDAIQESQSETNDEESSTEENIPPAEEEKTETQKSNVHVDPIIEFVESHKSNYDSITKIIDVYFGTHKSEKLEELTGCISSLDENLKTASDQMGVILRKEKAAFSNLQFTIHTNNHIALSNTSRMLAALASKSDSGP